MNRREPRDIESILRDGTAIDRAIIAARRRVILRHRQLGVPLAIWRDGKVVEVSPESVELPEYDAQAGEPAVAALAGAWVDAPTAEELRQNPGEDVPREPI